MIQNDVDGSCGHFTMTIRPKWWLWGKNATTLSGIAGAICLKYVKGMLMMPVCVLVDVYPRAVRRARLPVAVGEIIVVVLTDLIKK